MSLIDWHNWRPVLDAQHDARLRQAVAMYRAGIKWQVIQEYTCIAAKMVLDEIRNTGTEQRNKNLGVRGPRGPYNTLRRREPA